METAPQLAAPLSEPQLERLDKKLQEYREALKAQGRAPRTCRTYSRFIRKWIRAGMAPVQDYLPRHYAESSHPMVMAAIRSWKTFLGHTSHIPELKKNKAAFRAWLVAHHGLAVSTRSQYVSAAFRLWSRLPKTALAEQLSESPYSSDTRAWRLFCEFAKDPATPMTFEPAWDLSPEEILADIPPVVLAGVMLCAAQGWKSSRIAKVRWGEIQTSLRLPIATRRYTAPVTLAESRKVLAKTIQSRLSGSNALFGSWLVPIEWTALEPIWDWACGKGKADAVLEVTDRLPKVIKWDIPDSGGWGAPEGFESIPRRPGCEHEPNPSWHVFCASPEGRRAYGATAIRRMIRLEKRRRADVADAERLAAMSDLKKAVHRKNNPDVADWLLDVIEEDRRI